MDKKVIILLEDGKMVDILDVKNYTDSNLLHQHVLIAKKNKEEHEFIKAKSEHLKSEFVKTRLDMADLKSSALFNEIQLLKGEIDENEYQKLDEELGRALKSKQEKLISIIEEADNYGIKLD